MALTGVNWLGTGDAGTGDAGTGDDGTGGGGIAVEVKLRSAQKPVPATVHRLPDGTARVELHAPEIGVAAGQACVFYAGERVLGGGWIDACA